MANKRVLVVGSAEQSAGGVSSVIKLIKKMPVWEEFSCYWLGTQIQRNYLWKAWYALKANLLALFLIWRFDIVHFHTTPDKSGLIVQLPILLLAKFSQKKIILHVHMGNQLSCHVNNRLFIFCLRQATLIVLLAKKWDNLFKQLFPQANKPTTYIYNACETLPDISFDEKKNTIILMAYMIPDKGIDVMLKAWEMIHDSYPSWKVYMMGRGEVDRYRELANSMDLSKSMEFTGYVRGNQRERLLREASISVMCSYNEGFPMVVLEAWTYGATVVTTRVGGLTDVIEEGVNCLTIDFGDYRKLSSQLSSLMDNKYLRENIATNARACARDNFSLEIVNRKLESVYRSL